MSDRWGAPSTRPPPPTSSGSGAKANAGAAATWRPWETGFTRNCDEYDMMEKIGEGTYGQVYKARQRRLGHLVAMKKMRIHSDAQGFPLTAVREVKILKKLTHVNMVALKEVITSRGARRVFDDDDDEEEAAKRGHGDIFVVLEYVDHDLTGLLDERYVFQPDEVKCIMRQLLEVLKYLHDEKFVHRDLKCSNLLLSHDGTLKLADFGLARSIEPTYTGPSKTLDKLTNNVITLWYRPPELLLGLKKYSTPVDMWSAGCILAELILRKPLFPGKTELEQLDLIFRVLGTPTPSTWPQHESLPRFAALQPKEPYARTLEERYAERFAACNRHALSLTVHLLNLDPSRRRTARAALELPFFAGVTAQSRHPLRVASGAAFHEWKSKEARRKARAQAEQGTDNSTTGVGDGGGVNGSSSNNSGNGGARAQDNGRAGSNASINSSSSSNSSSDVNPWSVSADDVAPHSRPVPPQGLTPGRRVPPGLPPRPPPGMVQPSGPAMGVPRPPGLPPPPRPPLPPPAAAGVANGLTARRAGLPQPPTGPPPWSTAAAPPPPQSSSQSQQGAARPRHDSVDMDESPPHPSTSTSHHSRAAGGNGRSPPRDNSRSAPAQPSSLSSSLSSSSRPRSRTPPRGTTSGSGGGGNSGGGGGGHDTDDFLANFVDEKPVAAAPYVYGKSRARSKTPPQAAKAPGDICDELAAMAGLTDASAANEKGAGGGDRLHHHRGRAPSRSGDGGGGGGASSRGRRSGRGSSSDSSSMSSTSSSSRSRSRSPSRSGRHGKSSAHKSSRRSSSGARRSSRSRSRARGGGGHRSRDHGGYGDHRYRRSRSRSRDRDRSYRR